MTQPTRNPRTVQRSSAARKSRSSARKTRNKNNGTNTVKIALICILGVLVITGIILGCIYLFGGSEPIPDEEYQQKLDEDGKFVSGVSVAGIDLAGMDYDEALAAVKEKTGNALSGFAVNLTVNGERHAITRESISADIDYKEVLNDAILYGNEQDGDEKNEHRKEAAKNGKDFPLAISVNDAKLKRCVEEICAPYEQPARDASVEVVVDNNEEKLKTSGRLEFTEEQSGFEVDKDKLISEIREQLAGGAHKISVQGDVKETLPQKTLEELKANYALRASYTTKFKSSKEGRRHNIWKMATYINGVVLQPGEEFSINDTTGIRTDKNGWKDAAGIKGGAYVEEPGGGICQVSCTLYIALMKSEVEVTDRHHHSWPSDYVPIGMDATISNNGPDFKFRNNYDCPIAVIIDTDGKDARTITVSIYGPEMDYSVRLENNIITDEEPGPLVTVYSSSATPGSVTTTKPRHNKIVVEIYKIIEDKETGKEISRTKYYTDTYRAFAGEITVGPSPTATATPTAVATPTSKTTEESQQDE